MAGGGCCTGGAGLGGGGGGGGCLGRGPWLACTCSRHSFFPVSKSEQGVDLDEDTSLVPRHCNGAKALPQCLLQKLIAALHTAC